MAAPLEPPATSRGLHVFACLIVGATLVLVFAGGLVTSTGSGLAVPDWPLSFGQVFPEMKGGVFYEHGHRLIASFVGLLTVILGTWVVLRDHRASVRGLAVGAVVAVMVQGILGGVTVLYQLPPAVSIVHACLAQAFLCMVVTLAVVTSSGWSTPRPRDGEVLPLRLAVATTAMVYGQLILGAVMRHTGAGLAITNLSYPFGPRPSLADPAVQIHALHRGGAVLVFVLASLTIAATIAGRRQPWLALPALLLAVLVALQIAFGAATVWSKKAPLLTTAHVACGAAVLATSLVLALRTSRVTRLDKPGPAPALSARTAAA